MRPLWCCLCRAPVEHWTREELPAIGEAILVLWCHGTVHMIRDINNQSARATAVPRLLRKGEQ
jgi:hypothetical protein